ncbi:ABC transporter permease [Liquorilactobacillus uvarum]|uniref:ABC transporter permease n=1 Tax=Liquorilactobacillus uvarum TaxID=303240 RepID=UPI00288A9B66|nr:ABC transporter permease [Liquorilactobacillus uvarum]
MVTLIRQELFKLMHKKSTIIGTIALLLLMTIFAVFSKLQPSFSDPKGEFIAAYGGTSWVVFFMIAACSTIVAMEFQYGTIKELLYRKYYRGEILASKWITMFIYSLYFYVLSFVFSVILKVVLFNSKFSFSDIYTNDQSVMHVTLVTYAGNFVGLWLLLSLVLLLANVFKSSAAAISVGIVGYFATSIVSSLMFMLINKWEWLKWNPLNMLNLSDQLSNSTVIGTLTRLSNTELVWGNLVYTGIFLFLGYLVFRRRNV